MSSPCIFTETFLLSHRDLKIKANTRTPSLYMSTFQMELQCCRATVPGNQLQTHVFNENHSAPFSQKISKRQSSRQDYKGFPLNTSLPLSEDFLPKPSEPEHFVLNLMEGVIARAMVRFRKSLISPTDQVKNSKTTAAHVCVPLYTSFEVRIAIENEI